MGQTVTAEGAEVILLKGGTASYAASAPLAFENSEIDSWVAG